MKLLVVDDQGPVGAIISRIAQQSGWEAINTTICKGIDQIIRREKVDVLMMDFIIENENSPRTGLTLVEDLRNLGFRLPIILFTGRTDLVDQKKALELGVQAILEKPLSIQELRTRLNDAKKALLDGPLSVIPS